MATIKKAQKGTSIKGNPKGYKQSTSPLKTGDFEKKIDTVGTRVRTFDGKGTKTGDERLGSSGAKKLASSFTRSKNYTDEKRGENKKFLNSREAVGKAASKLQKGGAVKKVAKKYSPTAKEAKNIKDATKMKNMRPVMKSGGAMGKCKNGCK